MGKKQYFESHPLNDHFHLGHLGLITALHKLNINGYISGDVDPNFVDLESRAEEYIKPKDFYVVKKDHVLIDLTKMRLLLTPGALALYESSFINKKGMRTGTVTRAKDTESAGSISDTSFDAVCSMTNGKLRISKKNTRGKAWATGIPREVFFIITIDGYSLTFAIHRSGEGILGSWVTPTVMALAYSFLEVWMLGPGFTVNKTDFRKAYTAFDKKLVFGKMYDLSRPFYHFTIPKKNKKGVRLISSPRYDLKCVSKVINTLINSALPSGQDLSQNCNIETGASLDTLSYWKGSDFLKELANHPDLSTERAGRFVLQIDFRDFFTNISVRDIQVGFDNTVSSVSGGYGRVFDRVSEALRKEFPNCIYSDVEFLTLAINPTSSMRIRSELTTSDVIYHWIKTILVPLTQPNTSQARTTSVTGMARNALTTTIPIWKSEVLDVDVESIDSRSIRKTEGKTVDKALRDNRKSLFSTEESDKVRNLYEIHSRTSMRPWSVRGLPQGICYSGMVANVCAISKCKDIIKGINTRFENLGVKVKHAVQYSDNLYLFYDTKSGLSHDKILIDDVMLNQGPGRWFRRHKMSVVDRNKRDIKMLGLLIDKEGKTRLSRLTMRKINQAHIRAHKGDESAINAKIAGREIWFKRVRTLADNDGYSRKLITEKKEVV